MLTLEQLAEEGSQNVAPKEKRNWDSYGPSFHPMPERYLSLLAHNSDLVCDLKLCFKQST
jgi:hypothetical protein